jgi:hypothetical protein
MLYRAGTRSATSWISGASRWTPISLERLFGCWPGIRKDALFAGLGLGGQHWAVLASLIQTCELDAVEPHVYLADVLTRLVNGYLNSRIDDLTP